MGSGASWTEEQYKKHVDAHDAPDKWGLTPEERFKVGRKIAEYERNWGTIPTVTEDELVEQAPPAIVMSGQPIVQDVTPAEPETAANTTYGEVDPIYAMQQEELKAMDVEGPRTDDIAASPFQLSSKRELFRPPELPGPGGMLGGMLQAGFGGNVIDHYEPTLRQVRNAYRGQLSEEQIDALNEGDELVNTFRDAKYAEAFDYAKSRGWGIRRLDILHDKRPGDWKDKLGYHVGKVDDWLRTAGASAMDAATFGLAGTGLSQAAGLFGGDSAYASQALEEQKASNLSASIPGAIGGAVLGAPGRLGMGAMALGAKALGAGSIAALPVLARAALAIPAGAGVSAIDEAARQGVAGLDPNRQMSPTPMADVGQAALIGGAMGPAAELVGAGVSKLGAAGMKFVRDPETPLGKLVGRVERFTGEPALGRGKRAGGGVKDVPELDLLRAEGRVRGMAPWDVEAEKAAPKVFGKMLDTSATVSQRFNARTARYHKEVGEQTFPTDNVVDYVADVLNARTRAGGTPLPFAELGSWQTVMKRLVDVDVDPWSTGHATSMSEGGARSVRVPIGVIGDMFPEDMAKAVMGKVQRAMPGPNTPAMPGDASATGKAIALASKRALGTAGAPGLGRVHQAGPGVKNEWSKIVDALGPDHEVTVVMRPARVSVREIDETIRLADNEVIGPTGKRLASDPAMRGYMRVLRELRDTLPVTPSVEKLRVTATLRHENGELYTKELKGYSALKHIESIRRGRIDSDKDLFGIRELRPTTSGDLRLIAPVAERLSANLAGQGVNSGRMAERLQVMFAGRPDDLRAVRRIGVSKDYEDLFKLAHAVRMGVSTGAGAMTAGKIPTPRVFSFAPASWAKLKADPLFQNMFTRGQVREDAIRSAWRGLPLHVRIEIRRARMGAGITPSPPPGALPGIPWGAVQAQHPGVLPGDEDIDRPSPEDAMMAAGIIEAAKDLDPDHPEILEGPQL